MGSLLMQIVELKIINEILESERKMQQNIVNENKYTGFGTKKTY